MDLKRNIFVIIGVIVFIFLVFGYRYHLVWSLKNKENEAMNYNIPYSVPTADAIEKMDNDTLYLLFDKYVLQNQFSCSNFLRQGTWNAFGKTICGDEAFKPGSPCILYSFGSQLDFTFEEAIWKSFLCEIHTFDPSLPVVQSRVPFFVNYHLIGLSGRDYVKTDSDVWVNNASHLRKTWEMRRLSSIQKSLSHTNKLLDILKIDIEGWEWEAFPDIIQTGAFKRVKQICVEVHFGFSFKYSREKGKLKVKFTKNTWGNVSIKDQMKVLLQLFYVGFRIAAKQSFDWGSIYVKHKKISTLVELTLVNVNLVN